MKRVLDAVLRRSLALLLAAALLSPGCQTGTTLAAETGVPHYQEVALVPVPGGVVNAAGANLIVVRNELSTDTLIGTREIRSLYDGRSGGWRFSFDLRFDGAVFVDETGARYDVSGLAPGEAIPGSVFRVVDATTIETRGGLAHHFDEEGRLAWIAWRGGDYPRIQYGWREASLEIAACAQPGACFGFAEVAFGAGGRPVAIQGLRTGRRVEYEWDALGRLAVARRPAEVENGWPGTRYEYSTGGTLLTASVSSEGERIEYAWQTGRRIRQVTQVAPAGEPSPNHRFRLMARDSDGLYPVVHVNPLGGETRYRFDASRRLREVERSESGEWIRRSWEGLRVAAMTLSGGETMSFTYEGEDVATWTQPSGNLVSFEYAPEGRNLDAPDAPAVARIEDDLGLVEERTYDERGRLVARANGEGETTLVSHHPGDAVASITDPAGVVRTHPTYGLHGHWLTQEGAVSDQRAFDPVGNAMVRSLRVEEGGVLGWEYDPARRVAAIALGASAESELVDEGSVVIERRSDGRVLRTLRPYGGDDEHVYDALGRRVERRERVDGVWRATTFEYDAAGLLVARTRPNGMREEFERDAFGRVVRHRALATARSRARRSTSISRGGWWRTTTRCGTRPRSTATTLPVATARRSSVSARARPSSTTRGLVAAGRCSRFPRPAWWPISASTTTSRTARSGSPIG